jgi:hypothetical protein
MHCGHPLASAMPDATVLDATADDFVMPPASVPGGGAVPVFTPPPPAKKGGKGKIVSVMTESWPQWFRLHHHSIACMLY